MKQILVRSSIAQACFPGHTRKFGFPDNSWGQPSYPKGVRRGVEGAAALPLGAPWERWGDGKKLEKYIFGGPLKGCAGF